MEHNNTGLFTVLGMLGRYRIAAALAPHFPLAPQMDGFNNSGVHLTDVQAIDMLAISRIPLDAVLSVEAAGEAEFLDQLAAASEELTDA